MAGRRRALAGGAGAGAVSLLVPVAVLAGTPAMVNDRWRARLAIAIVRSRATDQAGPGLLGPLAGAGNHGVGVVPG